jgi:hypothetical protein
MGETVWVVILRKKIAEGRESQLVEVFKHRPIAVDLICHIRDSGFNLTPEGCIKLYDQAMSNRIGQSDGCPFWISIDGCLELNIIATTLHP